MALLAPTPTTALGRAAREQHTAAREAKRHSLWWRRIVKGIAVTFIALFGALGIGGGTAQAGWPWEDLTTAVFYVCGPMDVPTPVNHTGLDTSLGMNNEPSDLRKTVVPSMDDGMDEPGDALERLNAQFTPEEKRLIQPTYERYGFSALTWTNYGNGCASKAFWLNGVSNFALDVFVKTPMILGMGLLQWTMDPDNLLFQAFASIVQPVATVLGALFQPWIFIIAPIGVFLIWVKTRSTMQVGKAFIWVISIYGLFTFLTGVQAYGGGSGWVQSSNPGAADPSQIAYPDEAPTGVTGGLARVSSFASNFVTEFASSAACTISETSSTGGACDPDNPMGNIHQSLWEGIPYQVWLSGEVGETAARETRAVDASGNDVSWGAALLNGHYAAQDEEGTAVARGVAWWNQASYADSTDADAKMGYWTGGNANLPEWSQGAAWEDVPYLANVKFLCNDVSVDDAGSSEEQHNRWMYGGSCDAAGAGTADMLPAFKGEGYSSQIVYAFAGMWAVIAVVLTIGLACGYLMAQKALGFWLLAFAPIFLAISTFADERRRAFAKRWGELLVSNVIKQCVAVVVVLFVSFAMSTLMENPAIPWIAKPYAAVMLMIAMVMFARPMANLSKAAVKGDTSVVDKMAKAPQNATGDVAKGLALAGVVAGTGGFAAAAAPAAGSVLSGTSLGGAAGGLGSALSDPKTIQTMSKIAGSRGGVGKGLKKVANVAALKDQVSSAAIKQQGAKRAEDSIVHALLNGEDGAKYRDDMGKVTADGEAMARKDARAIHKNGSREAQIEAAHQRQMTSWFESYEATRGHKHDLDPRNKAAQNGHKPAEPQGEGGTAPTGEGARPHGAAPEREAIQAKFADDAEQRFDQSSAAVASDVQTRVERTGKQVLETFGVSQSELAAAPEEVLLGSAYGAGDTARMDPGHAATEHLTTLRFAVQGTDEELERVREQAAAAIETKGLPSEVSMVRATDGAAADFHPAQFVGAIAPIDADTSWQERAGLAVTAQHAIAQVPEGHPAGEAADNYVSALANPAYEPGVVEALRGVVIEAFDQHAGWTLGQPQTPLMGDLPADTGPSAPAEFRAIEHRPDGLDYAIDMARKMQNGSAPEEADAEPPKDAPRGEGEEHPVTEYSPRRDERRSGIFEYDDEPDEDEEGGAA